MWLTSLSQENESNLTEPARSNQIRAGFSYMTLTFFLLKSESVTAGNYFPIIKAIADGNHKLGKIVGVLGLETSALTPFILHPQSIIAPGSFCFLIYMDNLDLSFPFTSRQTGT